MAFTVSLPLAPPGVGVAPSRRDRAPSGRHLPLPLQPLGHWLYWQASPVVPGWQEQAPVAGLHWPRLEQGASAWALPALPAQLGPVGHLPAQQARG